MSKAHDAAVERLRAAARSLPIAAAADAFLASLSTRELTWRRPLQAVVIARVLPRHEGGTNCRVCGFDPIAEQYGHSPGRLARFITELGQARPRPTDEDRAIFRAILTKVREQQALAIDGRERRADLVKALAGVFPSNKYERMDLLDELGRVSVLATKEHPGFLRGWVDASARASGSGNNEFDWPFAVWTASAGFDEAAVRQLFPSIGVIAAPAPRTTVDEARDLREVLKLSKTVRPAADEVARVVFAPGGLWLSRLTDGRYALLVKQARRWRWITGTGEDVVACVPVELFGAAVAAIFAQAKAAKAKPAR